MRRRCVRLCRALVGVRAVVDGKDYWISSEEQPADKFYPYYGTGLAPRTGGDVRVRVFVACAPIPQGEASSYVPLTEGPHTVKLKGTLAGIGELQTTETTVELRCPPTQRDGGAQDAGPSGAEPLLPGLDASVRDAPSAAPIPTVPVRDEAAHDASVRGVDASTASSGLHNRDDSGCHAGPRAPSGASALLVCLLAWLRVRTRARR